MLLAVFLGLALAGPAPEAPELLTHAIPRWPAGVDPKDENHVACAVRVVVGSDGVPTAAPSIAPACPPAFAASLREAVLERRWVADGHTHEIDVEHVFHEPIVRRMPDWPSSIDPMRINDVRCAFDLEIGADGVPVSVVGRQPCLPQFIHVGERALRRWRWSEADAPFHYEIAVTFRSGSGVVEQHLSMADLQRVMDAFEVWSEDPSGSAPGPVCVGGAVLRKSGRVAGLRTNRLESCVFLPTLPDPVPAGIVGQECTATFSVTLEQVRPAKVEGCKGRAARFTRHLVRHWVWAAPERPATAWSITVTYAN